MSMDFEQFTKAISTPEPEHPMAEVVQLPTSWDYFAEYIIEIRGADEEFDPEVEILDKSYIGLTGTMDSDMYYSECLDNADPHDFLPTAFTGKYELKDYEPGVYRLVYGVKCGSSKDWTDCGYEYDAWEEYDLISKYKMTDKEAEFHLKAFEDTWSFDEAGQEIDGH